MVITCENRQSVQWKACQALLTASSSADHLFQSLVRRNQSQLPRHTIQLDCKHHRLLMQRGSVQACLQGSRIIDARVKQTSGGKTSRRRSRWFQSGERLRHHRAEMVIGCREEVYCANSLYSCSIITHFPSIEHIALYKPRQRRARVESSDPKKEVTY